MRGARFRAESLRQTLAEPARALAGFFACLIVAIGIESAHHLVHHALAPDQGASCQVLRVAGNAEGVPHDVTSPQAPVVAKAATPGLAPAPPPQPDRTTVWGRAPPRPLLAAV